MLEQNNLASAQTGAEPQTIIPAKSEEKSSDAIRKLNQTAHQACLETIRR